MASVRYVVRHVQKECEAWNEERGVILSLQIDTMCRDLGSQDMIGLKGKQCDSVKILSDSMKQMVLSLWFN